MSKLMGCAAAMACLFVAFGCDSNGEGSGGGGGTGGASGGSGGTGASAGFGGAPAGALHPDDFSYQGAFRLPEDLSWGARGLSFFPDGDGGAGSLLVTGLELTVGTGGEACSWDGVTNCQAYFAELALPTPQVQALWEDLPEATFLRELTAFDGGRVRNVHPSGTYTNVFVAGIAWVPQRGSQTSDKLYGSLEAWYPEGDFGDDSFSTVWFSELDGSNPRGLFHVGPTADPLYHGRKMGDFLFPVPQAYADQYLGGRTLITGRARGTAVDGAPGLDGDGATAGGSQGPTLFAFHPWDVEDPTGNLDALPMLYYRVRYDTCAAPDAGVDGTPLSCDFPGYTMCDVWSGGSFVDDGTNRAILLSGWAGATNCYYCGDPVDDSECPVSNPADYALDCARRCDEDRGYHCGPYERRILFYDVTELGAAALGTVDPWTVLPYGTWRPGEFYLQGSSCFDVGGMAFDDVGRRLYVVERGLGGDNANVVHVWSL